MRFSLSLSLSLYPRFCCPVGVTFIGSTTTGLSTGAPRLQDTETGQASFKNARQNVVVPGGSIESLLVLGLRSLGWCRSESREPIAAPRKPRTTVSELFRNGANECMTKLDGTNWGKSVVA
ncbi:hypothetical protein L915_05503 [Phytophthora nicotianae]|uniref:Uncharacterized protein n=1 Tax=Phytophthora nicotianae TaxID=4792 RepID=W2H6G7_PHYNI|nr:hypothetical protein L915_05503 [Phytophthora nicotianae]